jgi:hypothetical protein
VRQRRREVAHVVVQLDALIRALLRGIVLAVGLRRRVVEKDVGGWR